MNTTIKKLKDIGFLSPTTFSCNSPNWPIQRTDGRLTLDYHKPIPDVVSLCELINTYPGAWYAAIDLTNAFSSPLSIRCTRSHLLSVGKASNTPLLSYIRGMSIHQTYVLVWFTGMLVTSVPSQDVTLVHHIEILCGPGLLNKKYQLL